MLPSVIPVCEAKPAHRWDRMRRGARQVLPGRREWVPVFGLKAETGMTDLGNAAGRRISQP